MKRKIIAITALAALMGAVQAYASTIVYTPKNPDISPTANPNNEASISAIATLNRPKQKVDAAGSTQLSEADLIKQSVINSLSSNYTSILTGSTSGNGTVNFGDGNTADYSTTNGVRTIIFHNLDGTSTTISFPVN